MQTRVIIRTIVRFFADKGITSLEERRSATLIAEDQDESAEHVDTVAGSEFVDDRLRLRE
jgi:hypothetical protein